MTADHVEAGVLQEVADALMQPVEKLKTSDKFSEIGIDSLDVIEIVMGIEERFELEISDENLQGLETIDDLVALVKRLKG